MRAISLPIRVPDRADRGTPHPPFGPLLPGGTRRVWLWVGRRRILLAECGLEIPASSLPRPSPLVPNPSLRALSSPETRRAGQPRGMRLPAWSKAMKCDDGLSCSWEPRSSGPGSRPDASARLGDRVVVVSALGVLLPLLDQLVLEQGLEGLVLRLLLGVVAGRVGDAGELLRATCSGAERAWGRRPSWGPPSWSRLRPQPSSAPPSSRCPWQRSSSRSQPSLLRSSSVPCSSTL